MSSAERVLNAILAVRPMRATGVYVGSYGVHWGFRTNRRKAPHNYVWIDDLLAEETGDAGGMSMSTVHERAVDLLENGARAQEDEAVVDEALRYILAVLKALPKVREALAGVRVWLEDMQWADTDSYVRPRCMECAELKQNGHAAHCELPNLLRRIDAALALLPTESEASDVE